MTLKSLLDIRRTRRGIVYPLLIVIVFLTLIFLNGCGGGGSTTAPAAVTESTNQAPTFAQATVSPMTACSAPCPVSISLRATDPDGQDVVCYIDFGDNARLGSFPCSESSAVIKGHTFTNAGTFNITLTARDPMAKTTSTTIPVTVTQNTAVAGNSTPTLSNFGCAPVVVSQNDPVACSGIATDADVSDTVTCVIDWADGNMEPGLACNAGNITHAFSATGTFAISMYPTDSKANGNAQSVTVTVNTAPSGAPAAPLVSTDIPAIASSTTFALTGTKGNNCTHLFLNGTEIVSNTSTSWSYTATLNEGTNTLNLVCRNNSELSSPTTTKTIRRDTTAPLIPILNPVTTPTTTAIQTVEGDKTRDCDLWFKLRGGTATMIDDDNTYDDSNQNDTVTWTYSVALTSGSNSLEFYCKDDAGWTSASVTSSITYSTSGGGGTCDNDSVCDATEDCSSCQADCGVCSTDCDNDSVCDSGETCNSCSNDCGTCTACDEDDVCDSNEDYDSCPNDCEEEYYNYYSSWWSGGYNDIAQDGDVTYAVKDTSNPSGGCVYRRTESGGTMSACTSLTNMSFSFQTPVSIAACKNDNDKIGVFDTDLSRLVIVRFSITGATYLSYFSVTGGRDSKLECDKDGNWLIADPAAGTVRKFNITGSLQWTYTTGLSNPADVATDSGGNVFIVNEGDDRVIRLTSTGNLYSSWGEAGGAEDEFTSIIGVALDESDKVFVLDGGQHRIKIFSNSGSFLGWFGSNGTGNSQFDTPAAVTASGSGTDSRACIADNGTVNKIKEFHPAP